MDWLAVVDTVAVNVMGTPGVDGLAELVKVVDVEYFGPTVWVMAADVLPA